MDDVLLTTLEQWEEDGTAVTLELVDRLLSATADTSHEFDKALKALVVAHKAAVDEFENAAMFAEARRLQELAQASRVRLGAGYAGGEVRLSRDYRVDPYWLLSADRDASFSRWLVRTDGGLVPYGLPRLKMIPALDSMTGRMAFVRLASSRITYVRTAVRWNRAYVLDETRTLRVTVDLPSSQTRRRNMLVTAEDWYDPSLRCRLHLKFTGRDLELVAIKADGQSWRHKTYGELTETLREHLTEAQGKARFVGAFLRSFKYSSLDVEHKNVRDFFDGHRYRLSLVEVAEVPVLLVRKYA
jgi:hypothetical protein